MTAFNVSNDVTKHVYTDPALVIPFMRILQIFAVPNAELHVRLEIQWEVEVGEDKLVRVQVIYHRHFVPQTRTKLDKLRQWIYKVVFLISDNHVQRVRLERTVTMATPTTVVRDIRDASHMAGPVQKLQGTDQNALRASIGDVTRAVISCLKANWKTKI